jgi:D-3-phosphoglycerate dehydrogenase
MFSRRSTTSELSSLKFENVALTPHVAFLSHESLEECTLVCIENIEKFIEGKLQNIVNPEAISSSKLP